MKKHTLLLTVITITTLAVGFSPVAFSEDSATAPAGDVKSPDTTEKVPDAKEDKKADKKAAKKAAKKADKKPGKMADVKALKIDEVKKGSGSEAKAGNTVTVHYTGWLINGTKFDSSVDRGTPFTFHLGKGEVIPGWDKGVAGMKVGGKRKLHIPPDLGYGANGAPPVIPPNSTLVFDVELIEVKG